MFGSDGATAMAPIEPVGWSSKSGYPVGAVVASSARRRRCRSRCRRRSAAPARRPAPALGPRAIGPMSRQCIAAARSTDWAATGAGEKAPAPTSSTARETDCSGSRGTAGASGGGPARIGARRADRLVRLRYRPRHARATLLRAAFHRVPRALTLPRRDDPRLRSSPRRRPRRGRSSPLLRPCSIPPRARRPPRSRRCPSRSPCRPPPGRRRRAVAASNCTGIRVDVHARRSSRHALHRDGRAERRRSLARGVHVAPAHQHGHGLQPQLRRSHVRRADAARVVGGRHAHRRACPAVRRAAGDRHDGVGTGRTHARRAHAA